MNTLLRYHPTTTVAFTLNQYSFKVLLRSAERGLGQVPLTVHPPGIRGLRPDRCQKIILERRSVLRVHALRSEDRETRQ